MKQECVQAYATIYGVHPSLLNSTHIGMVQMQKPCHPITSKSYRVMQSRRTQQMRSADINTHTKQMRQLMKANNALRSERRQNIIVAAVAGAPHKKLSANQKPPAKKPTGHQGAKQVKRLEQFPSTSYALSPEKATMYRSLSVCCNFLAQDKTDIGFGSKEVCR